MHSQIILWSPLGSPRWMWQWKEKLINFWQINGQSLKSEPLNFVDHVLSVINRRMVFFDEWILVEQWKGSLILCVYFQVLALEPTQQLHQQVGWAWTMSVHLCFTGSCTLPSCCCLTLAAVYCPPFPWLMSSARK